LLPPPPPHPHWGTRRGAGFGRNGGTKLSKLNCSSWGRRETWKEKATEQRDVPVLHKGGTQNRKKDNRKGRKKENRGSAVTAGIVGPSHASGMQAQV